MIAPMEARARPHTVTTPVFEGPLELLLALAEREELDILQVSLAGLTDAYLAELAVMPAPDPAEMADFLWLAARLLLLKSIRLLPHEPEDEEETDLMGWEEDVRRRLDQYRVYKQMAQELMTRTQEEAFAYPGPARPVDTEGHEQPLEVEALVIAFQSVLARLPPRPLVVSGRGWTIEEKLNLLRERLARGPADLIELMLDCADRLEAVVTFVALLELLRRGAVRVRQRERFGPIQIEVT